jgi:hypothetical protein
MAATIGFNAMALRPGGSGVQTYIRELVARPEHVTSFPGRRSGTVQADAVAEVPERMRTDVAL